MNYQFTIFRILFGSYLFCHFMALLPYGTELFSDKGLLGDGSLNLTPQLNFLTSPVAILSLLAGSLAASLCLSLIHI